MLMQFGASCTAGAIPIFLLYNFRNGKMAGEIQANVTAANFAQVRAIVGGALREKFEEWQYDQQRASYGSIDKNPMPPETIEIDLAELTEHVKKTGDTGDTALRTYALSKYERERREGKRG
jgi:hypothetical protein